MISIKIEKYCCEDFSKIENYENAINDSSQIWQLHHRAESLPCGNFSAEDLKKFNLYYNRPANELIFLTLSEHMHLHASNRTNKHREKISTGRLGIVPWNKGIKYTQVAGSKNGMFGKSAVKGRKWYTNGKESILVYECPGDGWVRGRFRSIVMKGMLFWNNGIKNRRSRECPGEGWKRGKI